MLSKKLKDALKLMGGKAIVDDGEEVYVVMTLSEFKKNKMEGVEGLTKAELVDKINNDIAAWKVSQEEDSLENINIKELGEAKEDEVEYVQ
jgi:hypothetical protein